MTRIKADVLNRFATACYQAMGVDDEAASIVADSLVQSDLWGHPSHGVMRLFWYAKRIESGAILPGRKPEILSSKGALSVMDGLDGIGQVAAKYAMEKAIGSAKRFGIGSVAVRNSGHFGTAMYFTRMAVDAGCVGFISTNASPAMAPWGGVEKRVGTNPWSWAAPAGRHAPMMLDIANTAVARGKLYASKARGEAIPMGWAVDIEGKPTADPAAGIDGTILPMAGHKGYAIATIMDMLSGVLPGSAFGSAITGPYVPEGRSGVGHLVIAIDIEAIRPRAEFDRDMEALIADLKSAGIAEGHDTIFYPGEIEAMTENRLLDDGIELPDDVVRTLDEGALRLGVNSPV